MKIKFKNATLTLAALMLVCVCVLMVDFYETNSQLWGSKYQSELASTEVEADGKQLLQRASHALFHAKPLSANAKMTIDLFGQNLVGEGQYTQAGQGQRCASRLEFAFGEGDNPLKILQICNRGFYYRFQSSRNSPKLKVVDLTRVAEIDSNSLIANQPTWLASGGLASFLRSLADNFDFETVEQKVLNETPVLVLRGRWNEDRLKRIIFGQINYNLIKDRIRWERMPKQLPQSIEIVLGNDGYFPLFPYEVSFYREREIDGEVNEVKIVSLQLFQLDKHAEIPPGHFEVNFEGMEFDDLTNKFVDRIQDLNQLQRSAQQNRANAGNTR